MENIFENLLFVYLIAGWVIIWYSRRRKVEETKIRLFLYAFLVVLIILMAIVFR